jgi:heptaprenyl diphosphate synthase
MKRNLFYLTYMAVLVTFAVVIHTVEAALPLPMPVPGVKLGLANIITLLAIVLYGLRSGLIVSILRTLLGSFFSGSFLSFGFWLSLAGGVTSCLVMALAVLLVKRKAISLVSVSILGAVTHNLAQLAAASFIIANAALFVGYFPLLLLLGVPTGLFTGLAAHYLAGITARVIRQAGSAGSIP